MILTLSFELHVMFPAKGTYEGHLFPWKYVKCGLFKGLEASPTRNSLRTFVGRDDSLYVVTL